LSAVSPSGAAASFCVRLERAQRLEDYRPPGIGGGEGTVTMPVYEIAVTSREGDC
jgi:hypothetical protein